MHFWLFLQQDKLCASNLEKFKEECAAIKSAETVLIKQGDLKNEIMNINIY